MTDAAPFEVRTLRRHLVFSPIRLFVLFVAAQVLAVCAWYFALPMWIWGGVACALLAQLTQPIWRDGDDVISVVRLVDGFVIFQDEKTSAGNARGVPFDDISEVVVAGAFLAINCDKGPNDGVRIAPNRAQEVAGKIRAKAAEAQA